MADVEVVEETTKEELEVSTSSVEEQTKEQEASVQPAREETVTEVADKIPVAVPEIKAPPPPAPAKPKMSSHTMSSSSVRSSYREYADTSSLLSDLSRDYRGTSPAVLEGIATHPALYNHRYLVDRGRPRISARSRKVIRDAEDLAVSAPGLKHMFEVQYQFLFVCLCALCFSFCVPNCLLLQLWIYLEIRFLTSL